MPKQVDHEARRAQIAQALMRIASRGGLEAVSLRDVAAEAGLSMGAIQHYFKTKEQMLLYAVEHANNQAADRVRERIQADPDPSARTVLRTLMVEMLGLSEESRTEYLTSVAFFLRAVSSAELAAVYRQWWPKLVEFVTDELRRAQRSGELSARIDPEREAEILLGVPDGFSVGLLLGNRTAEASVEVIDYYLDRLFAPR